MFLGSFSFRASWLRRFSSTQGLQLTCAVLAIWRLMPRLACFSTPYKPEINRQELPFHSAQPQVSNFNTDKLKLYTLIWADGHPEEKMQLRIRALKCEPQPLFCKDTAFTATGFFSSVAMTVLECFDGFERNKLGETRGFGVALRGQAFGIGRPQSEESTLVSYQPSPAFSQWLAGFLRKGSWSQLCTL